MAFKLNNSDNYESLKVVITKKDYPIIFKTKVEELLEQGAFKTKEEAEEFVEGMEIELELYYEKDRGLFAVEAEAVESCVQIASPYTMDVGEAFED